MTELDRNKLDIRWWTLVFPLHKGIPNELLHEAVMCPELHWQQPPTRLQVAMTQVTE